MGWSGAACSQKMHNAVPTRGRNSVQHLDAATKAGTACCPQPGPRPYLAPIQLPSHLSFSHVYPWPSVVVPGIGDDPPKPTPCPPWPDRGQPACRPGQHSWQTLRSLLPDQTGAAVRCCRRDAQSLLVKRATQSAPPTGQQTPRSGAAKDVAGCYSALPLSMQALEHPCQALTGSGAHGSSLDNNCLMPWVQNWWAAVCAGSTAWDQVPSRAWCPGAQTIDHPCLRHGTGALRAGAMLCSTLAALPQATHPAGSQALLIVQAPRTQISHASNT